MGFVHHNQIFDVIFTFFNYDVKNLIGPTLMGHVDRANVSKNNYAFSKKINVWVLS